MHTISNKLKKIIKESVESVISENIRLLTEKWSYSEDVDEEVDKLLWYIHRNYSQGHRETLEANQLYLTVGSFEKYKVFDKKNITIKYFVYECFNKDICDFAYQNLDNLNGFVEEENCLYITLYLIQYKIQRQYCERNLTHELGHILQIIYGKNNNQRYSKLMNDIYEYANEVKMNTDKFGESDLLLANIVYYSNKHEQDAFIQEYGRELKNNPSIFVTKNAEIYKILNFYKHCIQQYNDNIDNPSLTKAKKEYRKRGMNDTNFLKMTTKMLSRFEKKINNVEKNAKYELRMRLNPRFGIE